MAIEILKEITAVEPQPFDENKIFKYLKENGEPGRSTGFVCLDPDVKDRGKCYYTMKKGGVTDWTGFPGSGKTYMALEILITQSEKYGSRWALYLPDLGKYEEIIEKLYKMVSGKDFYDRYQNKITEEEIYKHKDWINHHFLILRKTDFKTVVTPKLLWEWTCTYKDETGAGVNGILIDSWKNLYHDMEGKREDQYLDYLLSYRNELADEHQRHFHTIAHSLKTELTEEVSLNGKKRRIPDAYDIKGGGSWFANGRNIITVDFPDKSTFGCNLYVSKTKPEGVGRLGAVTGKLRLDVNRGRYKELLPDGSERFTFDKVNPIPF